MRRGEALGLRWSDLNLDLGTASIRQTLIAPGYKLAVSAPKTKKSRRKVALDPTTVEVLNAPPEGATGGAVRARAGLPC